MKPIPRLVRLLYTIYSRYTAEEFAASIQEFRRQQGYWNPKETMHADKTKTRTKKSIPEVDPPSTETRSHSTARKKSLPT